MQRESLGPAIDLRPGYETFWTYIPHFIHSPFYVYAYAFGDCLVNSLYAVYERASEGFAERYLEMLAAGGTKHHAELLAPFGLDARDPKFWQGGLGVIERMIGELEGLDARAAAPRTMPDREKNRFSARAARYARVGANVGGVAARIAGARFFGLDLDRARNAAELAAALGGLKGPIMKVAQLLATIPEALPPEYIAELTKLQSQAPPMGWAFVKRRMQAELGPDWQKKFASFEHHPAAAASLGQVHRATSLDGAPLACKLQYADMQSAVEADLKQLGLLFAIRRRFDPAIDTSEIIKEIGARVREELDYEREAKHVALYRDMLADEDAIRVPQVWPALSTGRLLTLDWLDGSRMLEHKDDTLAVRNRLATAMFTAWWFPFSRIGVIHGDPHLGNYTVFENKGRPAGINLLDYGCIRIFPPKFVGGVVDSLQRAAQGRRRAGRARLRDLGLPQTVARADRHSQHLGEVHLRAADGGPRPHHRRRRQAGRIRPPAGVRGAARAAAKRPGDGAARVRADGSRRDRAWRRVPASARRAQLPSPVRGGDGGFLGRRGGQAPGRRAQARGPRCRRLGAGWWGSFLSPQLHSPPVCG